MVIDAQQVLTETLYESDKILKTAGANTATIITHSILKNCTSGLTCFIPKD